MPITAAAPRQTGDRTAVRLTAATVMATAAIVSLSGTAAERASAAGVATGLDAEVRASWTGLPLRAWAERAGELAGMPVIVDRRIDPDTPVTIDCRGEPLRDVLDRVAAVAGAKVDVLRSSVRIVPRPLAGLAENAERARDEQLARLPPGRRKAAAARQRWSWPVAARPHDLLVAAAREAGLDIAGLDEVPHDHFPAAALPPARRGRRPPARVCRANSRPATRAGTCSRSASKPRSTRPWRPWPAGLGSPSTSTPTRFEPAASPPARSYAPT
jgi:hypothetical protein